MGIQTAAEKNHAIASGINISEGKITNSAVAQTFGLPFSPIAGSN
jgi:alanine dehydrogenase